MPLVRIISRPSEYPTELVRDLRARGYEVETTVSGSEDLETSDLDITLDQCSTKNIAEAVTAALANKDVVILAAAGANTKKIRSIGMMLLSPEESMQSARKTDVPVQLTEIYTAMLRGRMEAKKTPITFMPRNWESAWHKTALYSNQRLSNSWKYGHAIGKNLGKVGAQGLSEAAIWIKSRKLNWLTGAPSVDQEPDLVPSMFGLSNPDSEFQPAIEEKVEVVAVPEPKPKAVRGFALWKPLAGGAVAILAVALLVHGFSHSSAKAGEAVAESKKAEIVPVQSSVQIVQAAGPRDVAKHVAADGDDFQEVVVRHFPQTAPAREFPKDGIKRRVVVD